MHDDSTTVPYGFCHCGCGKKAPIATYNHGPRGMVKGEPLRFIRFHHGRKRRPAYLNPSNPEQGIVPLTHGYEAVIDAEDIDRVSAYTWRAVEDKNTVYAVTLRKAEGKGRREKLSLHRFVLGVSDPSVKVDHIDGDGLNNTKRNLRFATSQQNAMNMRVRGKGCVYKGVSKYKHYQKWAASIRVDGKQRHIGYFDSPEDAARAYDDAARVAFGEYAALNFPNPGEQSALLVKDTSGNVRATIAIEIPEVREYRERKAKA